MENDYLWDKTGEDAEIEQMEKALQVFRYQENKPPMLPVQVAVTEPRFSFFNWRLAFAFAVMMTVFLGGLAVWLRLQPKDEARLIVASSASEHSNPLPVSSPTNQPEPERTVLPPENKSTPKPRVINAAFRSVEVPKKINRTVRRKAEPKIQLTTEEKFAFNQLMLALSITGSKLQEVKTMVNGGEENVPAIKSLR